MKKDLLKKLKARTKDVGINFPREGFSVKKKISHAEEEEFCRQGPSSRGGGLNPENPPLTYVLAKNYKCLSRD